jgi:ribose transport system ATP-binding protein
VTAVLEVRDVAKRFGATTALDGVDLTLSAGEVHALIGENGAGKSTLMSILAGAVRPDRGAMQVDGRPYTPAGPRDARQRGVALIHQELCLCPHLSAAENVLLGLEPARGGWVDRDAARRRTVGLLEQFGRSGLHPEARVGDLPLAAQQVVEICRALAADARIVLMDEPTSSLQRADVDRLFALIRGLAARGIAIIYISHFLEEVREIAGRYTVLRDGRSVASGSITDASNDQLIAHMVGRAVLTPWPPLRSGEGERHEGDVILAVHDLAAPPLLKQASFELRRGEVLGIAGLMGSGRSELIRALFGLEPRASGRIVLAGRSLAVSGARPSRRLAQGFGYLSEDRRREGLALALSVADNLTATRFSACSPGWGWLDLDRQRATATRWIDALHIRAAAPTQPVRALSGGNQQKVAVGRLLHQDAAVLLLDEPTRGIDVGSRAQIYEAIARCAGQGKAVVLVSSYLPELFGLCDRLAVMSRGRLSAARPVEQWTPETVLATAIGEPVS